MTAHCAILHSQFVRSLACAGHPARAAFVTGHRTMRLSRTVQSFAATRMSLKGSDAARPPSFRQKRTRVRAEALQPAVTIGAAGRAC